MMNLQEFQQLSKRTMPFGGEPSNPIEFQNMLGNYSMGIVGEAIETMVTYKNMSVPHSDVTRTDLAKELGDVAHYAVGLTAILKIKLPETISTENYSNVFPIEKLVESLVDDAGVIVEHVKKVIYHGHSIDMYLFEVRLHEIFKLISDIGIDEGYELSDIFEINIDKLKTRYPEKFSTADSIARVDVVEGKA